MKRELIIYRNDSGIFDENNNHQSNGKFLFTINELKNTINIESNKIDLCLNLSHYDNSIFIELNNYGDIKKVVNKYISPITAFKKKYNLINENYVDKSYFDNIKYKMTITLDNKIDFTCSFETYNNRLYISKFHIDETVGRFKPKDYAILMRIVDMTMTELNVGKNVNFITISSKELININKTKLSKLYTFEKLTGVYYYR